MGLQCTLCNVVLENFALFLSHIKRVHREDPNFRVLCGIDGCGVTYKTFYGYRSHIYRSHKNFVKNARDITQPVDFVRHELPEEQSDDEFIGELLSDDDDADETFHGDLNCTSAAYLLRIKESHNLSQKALDDIIQSTTTLISVAVKSVCVNISKELSTLDVVDDLQNITWQDLFRQNSNEMNPFQDLETEHRQRQVFKEKFGLVEPVKRVLGHYHGHRLKGSKRRRVQCDDEVIDIPFLESLEQWLNDPSILKQVENPHQRHDGMISDYCDARTFKEHPLFSRNPQALQIILYYDEVEVVNPLGSKTSKHKVGVFYYTLGNIDPLHRSQLKAMQLLAVAKRSVIKKYGCNEVLRAFIIQLDQLEQDRGYEFLINGEQKSFTGTVAFVSGDNLASQEMGGFKIGSSAALKCRVCMRNANDVATKFEEDDFELRTRVMYDRHCRAIENSDEDITSQFGINARSILNQSRYFHVIEGLPGDAMHDLLEGLLQYEVKELIKYAISEKFFTLDNLNQWIRDFDYGYADVSNKPSVISTATLNSCTNSLKQRASQMWCLGRFLPLMIGPHMPGDDEKWHLFLTLLDIVEIVFAEVTTNRKASYLRDLITEHHNTFVQLYPNCSVIPKMHYLLHYPRTMKRLGPMVRSWTMRFEAKHERLKKLAASLGNFTNIPWTLALRHQLRQCYELSGGRHGQQSIEKPLEVGPGTQIEANNATYFDMLSARLDTLEDDDIIHEANWCTVHGTKYKKGGIVHTGSDGIFPEFSEVQKIVTVPVKANGQVFFILKEIVTLQYDSHLHAFKVRLVNRGGVMVRQQSELVTYKPLNICSSMDRNDNSKYICPKYDLDIYNEQM